MDETIIQQKRERKPGDLFTGRRKTSVARVKLIKGSGKITVNKKPVSEYFGRSDHQDLVTEPFRILSIQWENEYDVIASVRGGGITGQAEAVRLGLSRCLDVVAENYHVPLRKAGLLTRDPRMVERKKFGLHKARRASQFSKR